MKVAKGTIVFRVLGTALLWAALHADVQAQLTGTANSTTGTTCSTTNNTTRFCGATASFPTPNDGTTFTAKYGWNLNADVGSGSQAMSSTAVHNLSFNATAPGGYRIDITTTRIGDMNRIADAGGCNGTLAVGALTGSSNVPLSAGSLNLADLGDIGNGNFDTVSPVAQSNTATIFRVSNGVAQGHTMTFTWSGNLNSATCEVAARFGLQNGTTTGCNACGYAGSPARTEASDGQFVTVTYTSLCGNGTVDPEVSEQCDEGAANGTAGSCCNSNCTFKSAGTFCRAAAGVCDVDDTCTGAAGACPNDFEPASTVCRPGSGDLCDPDELCTGTGPNCPADVVSSAGTVCNPGSGDLCDPDEVCSGVALAACPADSVTGAFVVCRAGSGDTCDPDELCTGVADQPCPADTITPGGTVCNPGSGDLCDPDEACTGMAGAACPADTVASASTVCRAGSGDVCDPDETCPGTADQGCPADTVSPAGTECRANAGNCDTPEQCDGNAGVACPADVVLPAATPCRPSAGVCDTAEACDGSSGACPADAFLPNTTSCRAPAGACDAEEFCTGAGAACPGDAKLTSVCRPSAGDCDIAESCDGSANDCPADAVEASGVECRAATAACDTAEFCDGSSTACPAETTLNSDGEGAPDGCDPCNNIIPVYVEKPFIKVRRLATSPGDDTFQFKGRMTVPVAPAIDPLANGARIVLQTNAGTVLLDATIPPGPPVFGAGWTPNAARTNYLYRNRGTGVPTIEGVTKFKIKLLPAAPGKLFFNVKGKRDNYIVPPGELPMRGTIVIDSPVAATGQCGEALFQGTVQNPGTCAFYANGATMKCK